jgi:hypothetical protein
MLLSIAVLLTMFMMGGVRKIYAWYSLQYPGLMGFASLVLVSIYALMKRKFNRLMASTLLLAIICLFPVIIMLIKPMAYPSTLENTKPSATVRLPANVPLKVGWGGDKIETNYHAIAADQRWAYDLLVAPYATESAKLEDYGCYGVPVLAPASGLVVKVHDGEPDEIPGVSRNLAAPTGNHVAIRLGETQTYLIIAHLKTGSIAVKPGDTLVEGQVIGQCGNSGNTSEPHIHIHHQRQDPNLYPLNYAEGLPLYFRDHKGPPMPKGGFKQAGGKVVLTGDTVQHMSK